MRDNIHSGKYDLSEEGFIRRNKNWEEFSEKFRDHVRKGVAEFIKTIAIEKKVFQAINDEIGSLDSPSSNPQK